MTSGGTDRQDVLNHLDRVLSSAGFARNERMSRFFRFIVERHLEGRDAELKESVIGVEVFGRRPDYDPKLDSIVRTEAGRLRARLAEYYARGGLSDPIVLELPKGGYVPVVRFGPAAEPARPVQVPDRSRWLLAAAAALLAGLRV